MPLKQGLLNCNLTPGIGDAEAEIGAEHLMGIFFEEFEVLRLERRA